MGGNALKEFGSVRVSTEVEQAKGAEVISVLGSYMLGAGLPNIPVQVISYRQKADHGDIDLIVPDGLRDMLTPPQIAELLSDHYGVAVPCVFRGQEEPDPLVWPMPHMISLGVPLDEDSKVQVDLIYVRDEEMDYALGYYCWNDCGNLMGVIAKHMGLKFGHKGLSLPVNIGNRYGGEVLISLDFQKSLEFLGFSYERWAKGFDTMQEIFEYVSSSSRFDPALYLMVNRNHSARTKDKKRPTYTGFLEFLRQTFGTEHDGMPASKDCTQEIFEYFPEAKAEYDQKIAELEGMMAKRARLNGQLVKEETGLTDNDLGVFIESFKKHHGENFENQVLAKGEEHLRREVRAFRDREGARPTFAP